MEIHKIKLYLKDWNVVISTPEKVLGENSEFYFTKNFKCRRTDIGKPVFFTECNNVFLQLVMLDTNEAKLRDTLGMWLTDKAFEAWSMKMTPAKIEPAEPQYGIKISYSWGDEEPLIPVGSFEDTWEKVKKMALLEAEITGESHECENELKLDKRHSKITLHYTYDDTYCIYDVLPLSLEV